MLEASLECTFADPGSCSAVLIKYGRADSGLSTWFLFEH